MKLERKRKTTNLIIYSIVFGFFYVLSLISLIPHKVSKDDITGMYISHLYDETYKIELQFNKEVDDGLVLFTFYDEDNKIVQTNSTSAISFGNYTWSPITLNQPIDRYEVASLDMNETRLINSFNYRVVFLSLLAISLIPFIGTFLIKYKQYIKDENEIIVYSGMYKHYIKVNDKVVDQYNTFIYYRGIYLYCDINDKDNNVHKFNLKVYKLNRLDISYDNEILYSKKEK